MPAVQSFPGLPAEDAHIEDVTDEEGADAAGEQRERVAEQTGVPRKAEEFGTDEQSQFSAVQLVIQGINQNTGCQQRHNGRFHGSGQRIVSDKTAGPVEQGDDDKKQGGNVPFHKAIA